MKNLKTYITWFDEVLLTAAKYYPPLENLISLHPLKGEISLYALFLELF